MAHATHSNAALTVRARLRLARLIIDDEWPIARAAERYDVSWKTAAKWARRYEAEGADGLLDRSSRPHHQPNKTPPHVVRKIVKTRLRQRLGPIEIGAKLGLPASTVHAVLTRCHLNRLTHIDRATGERVRRYEHGRPGDLIHVDVKKLGRVPDGGGHRMQEALDSRLAAPGSKLLLRLAETYDVDLRSFGQAGGVASEAARDTPVVSYLPTTTRPPYPGGNNLRNLLSKVRPRG